jgi:hypothetical protein
VTGDPPVAQLDGPALVDFAAPFALSGEGSTAAPGRTFSFRLDSPFLGSPQEKRFSLRDQCSIKTDQPNVVVEVDRTTAGTGRHAFQLVSRTTGQRVGADVDHQIVADRGDRGARRARCQPGAASALGQTIIDIGGSIKVSVHLPGPSR